jgi:hypothetical protein
VNSETVNLKKFDNFLCNLSDLQKNKERTKNGKISIPPMRQSNCHALLMNIDRLYAPTPSNKSVKDAIRETCESHRTNTMNVKETININHKEVNGFFVFEAFLSMI